MSYSVVFFDLETTGLNTSGCDIIQIAAVSGNQTFNAYTVPRCNISKKARKVHGLSVDNGALFHRGFFKPTFELYYALDSFINFLGCFRRPVYLAAHNAKRFDAPVLTRLLEEFFLLENFWGEVDSFLDTLLLSKMLYPGLESYSQQSLVDVFLDQTYNAHDALEDAKMLQELYYNWQPHRNDVWNALI
ncbi:DNA polymerase III subunit epsilon-like [Dunckerocampus dactyliophorus]|uniref:DNA polymerase III subunit epsilon-like n=1 Tax=Dunckerocampus dactyliophorus TaxID=161453 RepID=UPI002406FD29|nr:DNA polymerase III subunit epsilon-like [Dunckerocampus dactyliophorus]XP_054632584.1 DNA polymerase III subunit epsilon-like [Dunckerocampus dactyliophorus]XP_054632585.1 DNA polymerase III subunit epsilon-like [Dunckerocampus dactyliophorus]XP_054632586.1 DNA polymerase III subunit epsilon-like [Dunckerocampus dactyliophorus]